MNKETPSFKKATAFKIRNMICRQEVYNQQLTIKVFEILAIASRKPHSYTIPYEPDGVIRVDFFKEIDQIRFCQRSLMFRSPVELPVQFCPYHYSYTSFLAKKKRL